MSQSSFKPSDISFASLAEMFIHELRRGVELPIDALVKSFPHLEEQIRDELPVVALLEKSVGRKIETPQIQPPSLIGGCRLGRVIGKGAMGIVYEAEQLDIGRTVAVKIIPLDGNHSALERFEVEAKAMGRVDHPHITPVYSYGHDQNFAYLVMKYIQGGSLYDLQQDKASYRLKYWMNEIRKDWNQFAHLGASIASGLQHAHDRGLVHRDIKPANILLDQDGKVWITDFGLAKLFDQQRHLSRTGDAIGTPRYMAPEQLRGISDPRSDVFSLGITLYEIVAGNQVWDKRDKSIFANEKTDLTIPHIQEACPAIPKSLAEVIMKCCEFDPLNRFQSANELEYVLRRFIAGKTKCDRRKRKRLPDQEYNRRSRRQLVFLHSGCLTLCITAGVAWGMQRPRSSRDSQDNANAPIMRSTVNLIDQLADSSSEDMLEIVTDYVVQSIEETSDKLHYTPEAKSQLRKQVEMFTSQIKEEGGINKETLDRFLQKYRETSLPAATRVMRASLIVEQSTMNDQEKQGAIVVLRHFAAAVANEHITDQESEALLTALVGRPYSTLSNLEQYRVPDNTLRKWVLQVNQRLAQLPASAFSPTRALEKALGTFIENAPLGDSQ